LGGRESKRGECLKRGQENIIRGEKQEGRKRKGVQTQTVNKLG